MELFIGVVFALACIFCWGTSDTIITLSLKRMNRWLLLCVSASIGAVIFLSIALIQGAFATITFENWWYMVIIGIIDVIGMWTFYHSVEKKGLSLAAPMVHAWAPVTIGLGMIFYGETVGLFQILGTVLIVSGMFIAYMKKNVHIDKGLIYAFFSMLCWGVLFFFLRVPNEIYGALLTAGLLKAAAAILSFPVVLKKKVSLSTISPRLWGALGLIGVLDGVGLFSYNFASVNAPLSVVAPIASATPVICILMGLFVLKEKLTKKEAWGVAVTILGMMLVVV
tara:strand:+ start:273 stop:1115 length:843 start_codon:yes stop_codon:yes gene_type:complete